MRLFNIVFVGLMVTVAACGSTDDANTDSQEPTTTDSDTSTTGTTTSLECEERSVDQCLDGLECHYISGREIHLSLIHISEPRDQRGSRMPSSA